MRRRSKACALTAIDAAAARAPAEKREQAAAHVRMSLDAFIADTGFHPEQMVPVAGALPYSHYSWFMRFIMKHIAKSAGAPTDTSRDYEFTDWAALDRFAERFAEALPPATPQPAALRTAAQAP